MSFAKVKHVLGKWVKEFRLHLLWDVIKEIVGFLWTYSGLSTGVIAGAGVSAVRWLMSHRNDDFILITGLFISGVGLLLIGLKIGISVGRRGTGVSTLDRASPPLEPSVAMVSASPAQIASQAQPQFALQPTKQEHNKAAARQEPPFWTDFDKLNQAFHKADRNSVTYRPDILLVFINNENSTPRWDTLPAEVLSMARIDLDVLAIDYSKYRPSLKNTKAIAADLRTVLSTSLASYRHLIFVARNAVTIVMQMLLQDPSDVLKSPEIQFLNNSVLTCRCCSIVNVATHRRISSKRTRVIEDAFNEHIAHYDIAALPTPQVLDFWPTTAQPSKNTDISKIEQGESSSLPGPLLAYLAERLSPFRSYWGLAIARQTIVRTCSMDSQVHTLFGNKEFSANQLTVASGESQAALLDQLTKTANTSAAQSLYVITGNAGVGKSVLLRMVARRLATTWRRGTTHASLPIFFPLSQFKLDGANLDPQSLWKLLANEWTDWVKDLVSVQSDENERQTSELHTMSVVWLDNQLHHSPTTLILDGVDEFMLNHPHLSLTDFASLLRYLRTEFRENSQLFIIVGIRNSAKDVTLITDSESQVVTLRGMSLAEASAIFPSAMSQLGHASDSAVQQLLLTPLILSTLEKSDLQLKPEAYLNRAALMDAAMGAIIASLKGAWSGIPYATSAWINALSLIAWFLYRELRGDIEDRHVEDCAVQEIKVWTDLSSTESRMDVVASFRILLDAQARSILLRHSIFFPVRENSYRLTHKEWGDYLVSHYVVLCIQYGHFDPLSVRALNHDIYIMAGQQLRDGDTDQKTVRALVERATSSGRFLIIGNFSQMLGNSFAPLTGDVLDQEIFGRLNLFPVVVRFALLSALSSRVLLNDNRDTWVPHFRSALLKALSDYARDEQGNALVRSMSWCFLRALTNISTPWPGLWGSDRQSIDTLSVITDLTGDRSDSSGIHRSVQAAFMRIQYYALEIPSRSISTIHYLYPLVLAYNHEISLDRTVVVELPSLLSDPQLDIVYREYSVSEVAAIWNRCKELYQEATARVPSVERLS
ncbi:MAG TPA: NACHT domain-containing protein [Candidatus Angelobacter sp.]